MNVEVLKIHQSRTILYGLENARIPYLNKLFKTRLPLGCSPPRASGPSRHGSLRLQFLLKQVELYPHDATHVAPTQANSLPTIVAFRL